MTAPAILLIDSSEEDRALNLGRGVKFNKANQDILEEMITLGDQRIRQIVVPNLNEPNNGFNSKKLTDALSRGYDYKLFFIMQASNRGPSDSEMVKMSKVNDCIKRIAGLRFSFHVIVTKIAYNDVYEMYQKYLAEDNCKSLLQSLDIPGFSFNFKVDGVSLVHLEEGEEEEEEESVRSILGKILAESEMGAGRPSTR